MRITDETRNEVREILRRAVKHEVAVRWRSSNRTQAGERRSNNRGRGDDFDGARKYMPGDDTRYIDWRRFAATGELMVRLYRQTTEINAVVVANVGPTVDFGTARATKRRLIAEMAASVIASLDKTKDRVGVMLFSSTKVEQYFKPQIASVRARYAAAAGILTQRETPEGQHGLTKALKRLPKGRSLVFIISDFMNMTDKDWETLHRVGRKHDVVCFYVQDVRERELPEIAYGAGPMGWLSNLLGYFYTLEDHTGAKRTVWVNSKTRAKYAENFRKHEAGVIARLKEARCRWLVVSTEEGDSAFPKITKMLGSSR